MGEASHNARILVVDDHPPMRNTPASILSYGRGLEVASAAKDGREAVLTGEELRPALVLGTEGPIGGVAKRPPHWVTGGTTRTEIRT